MRLNSRQIEHLQEALTVELTQMLMENWGYSMQEAPTPLSVFQILLPDFISKVPDTSTTIFKTNSLQARFPDKTVTFNFLHVTALI